MILDDPNRDLSFSDNELLQSKDKITEEELILLLAEKVANYLEYNPDLLMSYLYRLDVEERAIHHALSNRTEEAGHVVLAKLIWTRQKQRMESKKKYKPDVKFKDWEEYGL